MNATQGSSSRRGSRREAGSAAVAEESVFSARGRILRWLVLLLFLPGLLFANDIAGDDYASPLRLCSATFFVMTGLLLSQLDQPIYRTLWAWVTFAVFFLGYYTKALLLLIGKGSAIEAMTEGELSWITTRTILEALEWSAGAYTVFVLVALPLLYNLRSVGHQPPGPPPPGSISGTRLSRLLFGTIALCVASLVLPIVLGFGQMGIEHHQLPFRLDAVITRIRIYLVPESLLIIMWVTDNDRHRRYWWAALVTTLALGLADGILRGSRGSLIHFLLPVFFLWLVTNRFTKQRLMSFVGMMLVVSALHPFFSAIRLARMHEGHISASQVTESTESIGTADSFEAGVTNVASRVAGLDGLLQIMRYGIPEGDAGSITTIDFARVPMLVDQHTLSAFMTYDVVGIRFGTLDGRSPGIAGAFALVGGRDGVIVFMTLYTMALWFAWKLFLRHPLAPVLVALLGNAFLNYGSEGTCGYQDPLTWLVLALVSTTLYEFVYSGRPPAARRPLRFVGAA